MPRMNWADVCNKVTELSEKGASPLFQLNMTITANVVESGVYVVNAYGVRVRANLEPGLYYMTALRGRSEEASVATIRPVVTEVKSRVYEVEVASLSRASEQFKDVLINIVNNVDIEGDEVNRVIRERLRAEQEAQDKADAERIEAERLREQELAEQEAELAELEDELKADVYGERYGSW